MVHIKITKGLDIPISRKPTGTVTPFVPGGESSPLTKPRYIALNLDPFVGTRFKLHAKTDDVVKIGQPIVEDKLIEGRMFASPAGGVIREVRRGLKRRLIDMVIEVDEEEKAHELPPLDLEKASREELIKKLMEGGLFSHIRQRPFNILANPKKTPRSIFVKALESAPFVPSPELQVEGNEEDFQNGLNALAKLTSGKVHLIHRKGTACRPFTEAKNVEIHTVEGPHPVANPSLHIQQIDPIRTPEDVIWTVNVHDVIVMGHLLRTGRYFIDRVISIAGPGILPNRTGYYKVRAGYPVEALISDRIRKGLVRFISGDPLMGQKVENEDFLGFFHFAFCAIPENITREFLHFFWLGINKYSFSKAYISGHLTTEDREYDFTTNLHGEERAFVDGSLYDKVMPLDVSTMSLVKAVMAEDYDLAEVLGLLEVDAEDFALPTFVCPSKMEMTEIIKNGLQIHASEVLE